MTTKTAEQRKARIEELRNEILGDLIEKILEDEESEESYILNTVKILERVLTKLVDGWVEKGRARFRDERLFVSRQSDLELSVYMEDFHSHFYNLIECFHKLKYEAKIIYKACNAKTRSRSLTEYLEKEKINPKKGDRVYLDTNMEGYFGKDCLGRPCPGKMKGGIILDHVDLNRNKIYGNRIEWIDWTKDEFVIQDFSIAINFDQVKKCEWGRLTPWCY